MTSTSSAFCILATALLACSASTTDPTATEAPSASASASAADSRTSDRVVVPAGATLLYTRAGGLQASAADVSICSTSDATTYTFVLATGQLAWKACVIDEAKGQNVWATGDRIVAAADQAGLKAALEALRTVDAQPPCAGDYSETLAIDAETLYPPFRQCGDASAHHASGLDEVGSALYALAH